MIKAASKVVKLWTMSYLSTFTDPKKLLGNLSRALRNRAVQATDFLEETSTCPYALQVYKQLLGFTRTGATSAFQNTGPNSSNIFYTVCCRLTSSGQISILSTALGYQRVCLALLHSFLSLRNSSSIQGHTQVLRLWMQAILMCAKKQQFQSCRSSFRKKEREGEKDSVN